MEPCPFLEVPEQILCRSIGYRKLCLVLAGVGREQMHFAIPILDGHVVLGQVLHVECADLSKYVVTADLAADIRAHDVRAFKLYDVKFGLVSNSDLHVTITYDFITAAKEAADRAFRLNARKPDEFIEVEQMFGAPASAPNVSKAQRKPSSS